MSSGIVNSAIFVGIQNEGALSVPEVTPAPEGPRSAGNRFRCSCIPFLIGKPIIILKTIIKFVLARRQAYRNTVIFTWMQKRDC